MGEIGLAGEVRAVSHLSLRLSEIARLGFHRCVIPRSGTETLVAPKDLELIRVRNVRKQLNLPCNAQKGEHRFDRQEIAR